jgi:hypothetical protein
MHGSHQEDDDQTQKGMSPDSLMNQFAKTNQYATYDKDRQLLAGEANPSTSVLAY